MIILVGSEKGGVGKSTLATNIAAYFSANHSVILVDTDRQATSDNWLGDRVTAGLPQIAACQKHGDVQEYLTILNSEYNYVIVDSQGRDSIEFRSALLAADVCLSPFRPSQADLDTLFKLSHVVSTVLQLNPKLKVKCVLTQVPSYPTTKMIDESRQFLKEVSNFKVLDVLVGERKVYQDALATGYGVTEMNNEKAIKEIQDLCRELLND